MKTLETRVDRLEESASDGPEAVELILRDIVSPDGRSTPGPARLLRTGERFTRRAGEPDDVYLHKVCSACVAARGSSHPDDPLTMAAQSPVAAMAYWQSERLS